MVVSVQGAALPASNLLAAALGEEEDEGEECLCESHPSCSPTPSSSQLTPKDAGTRKPTTASNISRATKVERLGRLDMLLRAPFVALDLTDFCLLSIFCFCLYVLVLFFW